MTDAPELLLAHHLKTLRLPTFLRDTRGVASVRPRAWIMWLSPGGRPLAGTDRPGTAGPPDFPAVTRQLRTSRPSRPEQDDGAGRCEWIERKKRHRLGPSGTGKTHVALELGLACQKGLPVAFVSRSPRARDVEARDEKRLLQLQRIAGQGQAYPSGQPAFCVFQPHGINSSSRVILWSGRRSRTQVSQASGSTLFILAVSMRV